MKKNLFIFILCFNLISVNAFPTKASKFVEKQYLFSCDKKAHITVKMEHTIPNFQDLGSCTVSAITFGYGDIKIKGGKKNRISYTCFLDKNHKPIYSSITLSN